jgi:glycosyltransferase involved in cell wall biosynthesis
VRILVVAPQTPWPPNTGGRIRLLAVLRFLSRRRHEVTLTAFAFNRREYETAGALGTWCRPQIVPYGDAAGNGAPPRGPSPVPWSVAAYASPSMERAIDDVVRTGVDVVLLDSIFMTSYLERLPPPMVLQEQNIESQVLRQYAEVPAASILGRSRAFWTASSMLLEAYENRVWPRFAVRSVVSELDREEMNRRCARGATIVVENGVDVGRYPPVGARGAKRILFLASFDYPPNVDAALQAARHVMPLVRARIPDAELCIAGRHPPPAVRALAGSGVAVHADPPDVAALAARASVSLVPLRMGGGTRIKILEAFAWGVPVVSTALGCAGLRVVDGEHLLVRDRAEDQAEAVTQLLRTPALWERLRRAARRLVVESYDWETVLEPLDRGLAALR